MKVTTESCSCGAVTYIDHMGSDLSVVNAARVSFNKKSDGFIITDHTTGKKELRVEDKKLIDYLAKHKHWTPFAHTAVTLHIKAPLFVARQLGKHQVGFVWNEVSRRYVDDEPEFYVPDVWRKRAENVKQGSSDEAIPVNPTDHEAFNPYHHSMTIQLEYYKHLIDIGVAPEQARMVLPQSMYTEWYWTGNLYGFSNVYKLRTDEHSQKETQEVAKQIGTILQPLYPYSWEALTKE